MTTMDKDAQNCCLKFDTRNEINNWKYFVLRTVLKCVQ